MSTTTRHTKQKEIILNEIQKLYSHPTAKELHKIIKKKMPQIGFATIYRNLEALCKNNEVIKLRSKTNANETRYDGQVHPHIHLICKWCGDIQDVETDNIEISLNSSLGFKIDKKTTEISGTCSKCQNL